MTESYLLRDGDIMSLCIGGETVEGKVSIHSKEIGVKLLNDGIGLAASSKIMYMSPKIYTTQLGGTVANDNAVVQLEDMLAGLFHDYQVIMANKDQLLSRMPQFLKVKERCNYAVQVLQSHNADLKNKYKEGKLSQTDYMQLLRENKDKIFSQQRAVEEAFADIFGSILSECMHKCSLALFNSFCP